MNRKTEVVIIGGGPVGLFLGLCLSDININCVILEQRNSPVSDSRSLGIHPVSLGLFDRLGISGSFIESGLCIQRGIAHGNREPWGTIDFSELPQPFNFILACPQYKTEQILEQEFLKRHPHNLLRGAEAVSIHQNSEEVSVTYSKGGQLNEVKADFLIGCDGKNSFVRTESGIFFGGKRYPDTYIMGDFEDNTDFLDKAVVFLAKEGLIECFPLPNSMRRWVVKTDTYINNPEPHHLVDLVHRRTDYSLTGIKNNMLSSFGVQHFTAESFSKGRILLCGDSAHVVSPIGGQGMNLGWIGAWQLAQTISKALSDADKTTILFKEFEAKHRKIVKKAAKRAELNMRLGRKSNLHLLKRILVLLLIKTPLRKQAMIRFTMSDLI